MEAYSSWTDRLPIRAGGLVGHIFPPAEGRFVGGCIGFIRADPAERRRVGGWLGHIIMPGPRRFVSGCAGHVDSIAYPGSDARLDERADSEARTRWAEAREAA